MVFLVFTLRAILYKPFVYQVRSMRKMQEFQPEIAKLRKKYANDRQKQTEEMQRLQKEHGVNPLGGCLPRPGPGAGVHRPVPRAARVQAGQRRLAAHRELLLRHAAVQSFNRSSLFGAKLGNWVPQGEALLNAAGTSIPMLIVMIPLMIAAGIFTHITARHSVARQTAAQGENPQTAIMNKLMLYVFPIGVVVGAPFLPLAVLLYWVSNNLWTLGQQYVVYRRIDAEEAAKKSRRRSTSRRARRDPGRSRSVRSPRPRSRRRSAPGPSRSPASRARPAAAPRTARRPRRRPPPTATPRRVDRRTEGGERSGGEQRIRVAADDQRHPRRRSADGARRRREHPPARAAPRKRR